MRKALIIVTILVLACAGAGYYFYDKEREAEAQERAQRDSLRRARQLEVARAVAMDRAHRDSLAAYEKTHSQAVVCKVAERLIAEEFMSGRNHVGGRNWSRRVNVLRTLCDNVVANGSERADTTFRTFSFKGLMGDTVRVLGDSVMKAYRISPDSALVLVNFEIANYEQGQKVELKLNFEEGKWLIDDFRFYYPDGQIVSVSEEMDWFISEYGASLRREETAEDEEQ